MLFFTTINKQDAIWPNLLCMKQDSDFTCADEQLDIQGNSPNILTVHVVLTTSRT